MSKQVLQRLSFTAGELSPWLAGRSDLDPVARGASELRNFLVMPFGGLKRRPGTELAGYAAATQGVVRLMPFKYSDGDQFMLELGRGYIRYYKAGVPVEDGAGQILQTASPWQTDEQLRQLRMQQLNDVIYCVEPSVHPMTLSRYADDDWRLQKLEFSGRPYESSLFNPVGIECRTTVENDAFITTVTADADVFTPEMESNEYIRITLKGSEKTLEATRMPASHQTNLNRTFYPGETFTVTHDTTWRKAYTCIRLFNNATDYVSGSDDPEAYPLFFEPGADACSELIVNGTWTLETSGSWDAEWELARGFPDGSNYLPNNPSLVWHSVKSFYQKEGYRNNYALSGNEQEPCYYKVRLMAYKYGGSTGTPVLRAGAHSVDYELRVNDYLSARQVTVSRTARWFYTLPPDCETHDWSFGAFGARNGYPGTVEFYQGRLWFGATPGQPQTVWASKVDDYSSLTTAEDEDSAMMLTMAASQQNRVAWMASLRGLALGTEEGEWSLKGGSSGGVHVNNAVFERHSGVGSARLDALSVENSLLFTQRGATKVRELYYAFEADGLMTRDVSLLCGHLLEAGIVDWCVQQSAAFQVWCALADGTAVCMTMNKEQNIVAWHAHRLEHGRILSVAAMRGRDSGVEDVWFAVARREGDAERITLERMAEGNAFMDGAVRATVSDGALVCPAYMGGKTCYAVKDDGSYFTLNLDETGRALCPDAVDGLELRVGLPAPAQVRTMPLETVETMGRFKKQLSAKALLHESSTVFRYGTGADEAWRDFQPERYCMNSPWTGYARMSHNYGTDEQCRFALRVEPPVAFNLLALTLSLDEPS